MQTQEITIQGKTYIAPAPYVAGHVLVDGEANALNQLLAENLRNNFAAKEKKAKEDGKVLTQADFDAYSATYKFGVRPAIARVGDPIEAEARRLAKDAVKAALTAKGFKLKDLPEGKLDELTTEALGKYPKFREQAKVRVEARAAAVADLQL